MRYPFFEIPEKNILLAECVGTFFLVLAGCGAIIVSDSYPGVIHHGGIACAFGLIVMILIYSVGNVSGAHLNPAVTIAFFVAGRFRGAQVLPFIACQCLGAIFAAFLLRLGFDTHPTLGATLPSVGLLMAFFVEVILSAFLMFVILNVSTGSMEKGIMAGVAIGGTVGLEALIGGPLTGASMNPARSLGPALVSGHLDGILVYIAAPVLGMLIAAPACRFIQGKSCCD